jgi:hypothetical protein
MIQVAMQANQLLHAEGKQAIVAYVESQQNTDGGFRGRTADSDVYYTVFGLSCLHALAQPIPSRQVRAFLDSLDHLDFIHLTSAARCHMLLNPDFSETECLQPYLTQLEEYRAQDGSYHHVNKSAPTGTVYGSFLACLTYQQAEREIPAMEALRHAVSHMRTDDGGFANEKNQPRSTATTTAAALMIHHWIGDHTPDKLALEFIKRCSAPSGGYRAFEAAPAADLLSTATSLYALRRCCVNDNQHCHHEEFITSLWADNGGFQGHSLDNCTDIEYTFYALMALGCCA